MLVRIASRDNSRVKLVRKLASRKGRSEEDRFVVEGRNLIGEILERGLDVDFIMVSDGLSVDSSSVSGEILESCIASPDITVCMLEEKEFSRLTDGVRGIDMLAVVRMPHYGADVFDRTGPEDNILVLDRIQDPGNMGTLIRTAVAAGYKAVAAISGTVDVYSPKVLRATAGMIFEIPVVYIKDAAELRDICARSGKRMIVTVPAGGRPYYDEDLTHGIALVIGNEGRGVSDEILEAADAGVTLPMKGNIESLNAAVAAAILMYEAVRSH